MRREDRLQQLHAALEAGKGGVFIIASDQAPVVNKSTIPLDRVLDSTVIGAELRKMPGNGPLEVLAIKGVSDEALRSLNHRRDQLRTDRPLLLVFDPSDSARVSRVADDLWKWATVVELDPLPKTWDYTTAVGVIEPERYAPALRPSDVVGPREKPRAPEVSES